MQAKTHKVEHRFTMETASNICHHDTPCSLIWMLWDRYTMLCDAQDDVNKAQREKPGVWEFRINGEPYG